MVDENDCRPDALEMLERAYPVPFELTLPFRVCPFGVPTLKDVLYGPAEADPWP